MHHQTIDFGSQGIQFPHLELVVALHSPLFHEQIDHEKKSKKRAATIIHHDNGVSRHLRFEISPVGYTWSLAKSSTLAYLSQSGTEARLRAISSTVVPSLFSHWCGI